MEKKKTELSDKSKEKVRAGIYPMAGVYLIYTAYCMFREISVTSGNKQTLMLVFSIIFSIIGLAMILLGLSMTYKISKQIKEERSKEVIE